MTPREQEAWLRKVLGREPYHTAKRIEVMAEHVEIVPEEDYVPPSRPQDDGSDPGVPF